MGSLELPPPGGPYVHTMGGKADVQPREMARLPGNGTAKSTLTAFATATVSARARLFEAQLDTSAEAALSALGCGDEGIGTVVVGGSVTVTGGAVVVGAVVVVTDEVVVDAVIGGCADGVLEHAHASAPDARSALTNAQGRDPRRVADRSTGPLWQTTTSYLGAPRAP